MKTNSFYIRLFFLIWENEYVIEIFIIFLGFKNKKIESQNIKINFYFFYF